MAWSVECRGRVGLVATSCVWTAALWLGCGSPSDRRPGAVNVDHTATPATDTSEASEPRPAEVEARPVDDESCTQMFRYSGGPQHHLLDVTTYRPGWSTSISLPVEKVSQAFYLGRLVRFETGRLGDPMNTVTYTYDRSGHLLSEIRVDRRERVQSEAIWKYGDDGRLASFTIVDHITRQDVHQFDYFMIYDGDVLVGEDLWEWGEPMSQRRFTVDEEGRILLDEHTRVTGEPISTTSYLYDGAGRMVEESYASPPTDPPVIRRWVYDDAGQLEEYTRFSMERMQYYDCYTWDYLEDGLVAHRYSGICPGLPKPRFYYIYEYSYDDRGNLLMEDVTISHVRNVDRTTWTYDEQDRILSETQLDTSPNMGYSPIIEEYTYEDGVSCGTAPIAFEVAPERVRESAWSRPAGGGVWSPTRSGEPLVGIGVPAMPSFPRPGGARYGSSTAAQLQ